MRTVVITLSLALTLLSSASAADSIDQPQIKPAMGASSSSCPPAPPKVKPRTLPTPSAKEANPAAVVQVCAPVLSFASAAASTSSDKTPPLPQMTELHSDSTKTSNNGQAESADSFKFKIKDILEAEVKSDSRWLVWSVIAIFAVFAALIVLVARSPAAKSAAPWAVWLVGVAIVAALMLFVAQRSGTITTSQVALDKLVALYATGSRTAADESISRLEVQVEQLRREIRERDSRLSVPQASPTRTEPQPSTPGVLLHTLVFGILAATVAIAVLLAQPRHSSVRFWPFAARDVEHPPPATVPLQGAQPLDAIFRLEDELSMLAMNADKTYRFLEADKKPNINSPIAFLRALNVVRRELEGAQSPGEDSPYKASLRDFNFKEDAKSYDFYRVNKALGELDEALSSRYETKEKEWRPRALAALARARRELIAVCEPVPEVLATGNGDSAA